MVSVVVYYDCVYYRVCYFVSQLHVHDTRDLIAACVLRVGLAAVEKCGHGVFNQAGSGPRSMA